MKLNEFEKLKKLCEEYRIQYGCEGCPLLVKPEELCYFCEVTFPNDWNVESIKNAISVM